MLRKSSRKRREVWKLPRTHLQGKQTKRKSFLLPGKPYSSQKTRRALLHNARRNDAIASERDAAAAQAKAEAEAKAAAEAAEAKSKADLEAKRQRLSWQPQSKHS